MTVSVFYCFLNFFLTAGTQICWPSLDLVMALWFKKSALFQNISLLVGASSVFLPLQVSNFAAAFYSLPWSFIEERHLFTTFLCSKHIIYDISFLLNNEKTVFVSNHLNNDSLSKQLLYLFINLYTYLQCLLGTNLELPPIICDVYLKGEIYEPGKTGPFETQLSFPLTSAMIFLVVIEQFQGSNLSTAWPFWWYF